MSTSDEKKAPPSMARLQKGYCIPVTKIIQLLLLPMQQVILLAMYKASIVSIKCLLVRTLCRYCTRSLSSSLYGWILLFVGFALCVKSSWSISGAMKHILMLTRYILMMMMTTRIGKKSIDDLNFDN